MITYLPGREGYFNRKLEIIRLSIRSMVQATSENCDIFIFDNGSCAEMTEFLQERLGAGEIDYLTLSARNVGKIRALKFIVEAAPGEIVAYADDDILFQPGWLEPQLQVLETFPQVGMVSGVPVRNANTYGRKSLDALIQDQPPGLSVSLGRWIPDDWEREWAHSTGRDSNDHLQSQRNILDVRLEKDGATALGGANHFQFLGRKDVLVEALAEVRLGGLMGMMVELDERMDSLGYLRLSTEGRYVEHMGNALDERITAAAASLGIAPSQLSGPPPAPRSWIFSIPGLSRVLRWVYNRLFEILYLK